MKRAHWTNLNGQWDYTIGPREANQAPAWEGKITVPYCVESSLSGVGRQVGAEHRLWYRRVFARPETPAGERVLLHFGAVDWEAEVYVNGKAIGTHRGGHDPFSFDITAALTAEGEQELVVAVWDPTDAGNYPRGKQVSRPFTIWYTAVTGIWQTVWLETVPRSYVDAIRITPDLDRGSLRVAAKVKNLRGHGSLSFRILAEGELVGEAVITDLDPVGYFSREVAITLSKLRAWSPDDPYLYDVEIRYENGDSDTVDLLTSYAGLRKIEVRRDAEGVDRIWLNNRLIFPYGPLDQGWWPDGLYTAPTDEALRWDLEITKAMGFNMTRKHVKVEPARWYHHADRIGLLVWQDMPTVTNWGEPGHRPPRMKWLDGKLADEDAAQFRLELGAMLEHLHAFPCIVAWVPFNESWGQHNTNATLAWVKRLDPSRIINGPSGWNDLGYGETIDMHAYPGPDMWPMQPGRASVLGEFGGISVPVEGHMWSPDRNWGYGNFVDQEALEVLYHGLTVQLLPLVPKGLSMAVYTQLTDVEGEVNGLITYDRQVVKMPVETLKSLHDKLTSALTY
jgi:beta-galactosidase/beta-glucuronidase